MMKYGASYILPDGKVLRLSELGFKTHYAYERNLEKEGLIERYDDKVRYITNLNQWIRINDGSNFSCEVLAELPIKGITEDQYKALFEFLDYLRENGKKTICIGCEEHSIGMHFTDKSLWNIDFDLTRDNNKVIEYFIRDAYRTFNEYENN